MTERLVCLACGVLEAREVSPTEGCYRGSHALVPESVWRELYGSEADPPRPYKPVTADIDEAGLLAGKGREMQSTGEEARGGDAVEEESKEVAPATTGTGQEGSTAPIESSFLGPKQSLREFVVNHWDRWGKFDVDVLLSRARERDPSITNIREFASWLEKNGYTLERVRKKVYAERRG